MLDEETGDCKNPLSEMEMAMAFKEVTDNFERDHKVLKGHPQMTSLSVAQKLINCINRIIYSLPMISELHLCSLYLV